MHACQHNNLVSTLAACDMVWPTPHPPPPPPKPGFEKSLFASRVPDHVGSSDADLG